MPFKEKQKNPSLNPRKKPQYKIINWSEYNRSLKKRGQLSLYFPSDDLKSSFINDNPYVPGVSGKSSYYTKPYIEFIYTFYRLLRMPLRQIAGYFEDLWRSKGLEIAVPSFGHLSDSFAIIPLEVKHYCNKLVKRFEAGEKISLIVDSSGLSFDRASSWYEEKYGKASKNKPWRKLHISIDPEMEIYAAELTEYDSGDIEVLPKLITPDALQVDKVIGDGGYYSIEVVQNLSNQGITPVIPPPVHAVVHDKVSTSWHDKVVKYIQEKGTVYAFHKKYGYGIRSKVEAQFSRIKRCIGSSLQTEKIDSQEREVIIIANIINLWNSFGKPVSVKIV